MKHTTSHSESKFSEQVRSEVAAGYLLWIGLFLLDYFSITLPQYLEAIFLLLVGLLIIQLACQVLVTTKERFVVRKGWTHYVAGTASFIALITSAMIFSYI